MCLYLKMKLYRVNDYVMSCFVLCVNYVNVKCVCIRCRWGEGVKIDEFIYL